MNTAKSIICYFFGHNLPKAYFRLSTLQRHIRFENALIPSMRTVASVRHFGYSRSSGLAPGRVYFDDVTVFSVHTQVHTRNQRFQKASFSNRSTLAPFCSVFKKIYVQTYRFRIVFTRPPYNAASVLKTFLYSQYACSNELDACAFQYIGPRNWGEIEASW